MLEDFERARIADYFSRVSESLPNGHRACAIAITHLLPERPAFLHALAGVADLRAVLPKPKSIDEAAHAEASRRWRCDALDRARFRAAEDVKDVVPVDLDIHQIPANLAKGEPEHWHFDFRYLHRVREASVRLQAEEVGDHGWRLPTEVPQKRLAEKITRILGG
ncbi:hypothetical protein [Nocardiopsis synnemataformans]|uniref:hypothetical protein n=1 Tax=Nocardiopsis synnemataformans TaxID=61305 RepID=UPI003EB8D265